MKNKGCLLLRILMSRAKISKSNNFPDNDFLGAWDQRRVWRVAIFTAKVRWYYILAWINFVWVILREDRLNDCSHHCGAGKKSVSRARWPYEWYTGVQPYITVVANNIVYTSTVISHDVSAQYVRIRTGSISVGKQPAPWRVRYAFVTP